MYKSFNLMAFYTETSLHAGGETSLSYVDKPIQREKTTGFPFIQGSGVKGAIRDWFKHHDSKTIKDNVECVFGPETDGNDYAGAVSFNDARLLFFPVKSVKGVFAYITCPLVINRLFRDLVACGFSHNLCKKNLMLDELPKLLQMSCIIPDNSDLNIGDEIILEEYPLKLLKDGNRNINITCKFADFIANFLPAGVEYDFFRNKIKKDTVILNNDDFKDFVFYSTEIQTRIRIGKDKSTDIEKGGNLFSEENLPSDSILYTMVNVDKPKCKNPNDNVKDANKVLEYIKNINDNRFQVGGNETIGKGVVKTKFISDEKGGTE